MLLLTYVNTLASLHIILTAASRRLTNHILCSVQYQKCFQYTIPGPRTCKISQQFLWIFHTIHSSVAQRQQFVVAVVFSAMYDFMFVYMNWTVTAMLIG